MATHGASPPSIQVVIEKASHSSTANDTLTPPATEPDHMNIDDDSSSELSELDDMESVDDIEPDHYYEGGKIPVFKPTMDQFRSFKKFMEKIDKYGMRSGIVKVIPPKEWRDALPQLDEAVKTIRVKNPIEQHIAGGQGTYRQANMERQRSYNLPEWKRLCEQSERQPPARRGERRQNQERVPPRVTTNRSPTKSSKKRPVPKSRKNSKLGDVEEVNGENDESKIVIPPTPTSPDIKFEEVTSPSPAKKPRRGGTSVGVEESATGKGRQPKSVSERRKYNRRDTGAGVVDEAAFVDFDYRITNQAAYTPERCDELEKAYWKGLTFNKPLYGADMPGSLFDESTTEWNVAKLENLLDVLGQKVPGVNTAYLYLGMWKSTFAWHLEDVDLYSINYIHFGAPKQWYSISQEDARRFESAMKNTWPNDAKACSQFLRHKTYLISPALLQSQFNIRTNKLVHHEGEFVITFPYGYHSGYNLGYNCAESVNFATEAWLEYGRIAKKCDCQEDSVWVDVGEIERKLRGEETEFEETDDDEGDEEDDEADLEGSLPDLPTPPESVEGKAKARVPKRKREPAAKKAAATATKRKIKVRIRVPAREPCVLCPNDIPAEPLLVSDDGKKAHRVCALYTPETYISEDGLRIHGIDNIPKARHELKCNHCRSKRGAVFQCSHKKCARAYHGTCAAVGGVLVDCAQVPVIGDDGNEYTELGYYFRCKYHRPKRPKEVNFGELEESRVIKDYTSTLVAGDVVQVQYRQGEIFAGFLVENRSSEQTLVINILPKCIEHLEVEYKWVLPIDPSECPLPAPSPNAQPLPSKQASKRRENPQTRGRKGSQPLSEDPFGDADSGLVWGEFTRGPNIQNAEQQKVDLSKLNSLWHYLGATSTEARAQYTNDPKHPQHNPASVFLDTVRAPGAARRSMASQYHSTVNMHALNASRAKARAEDQAKEEKPYVYKPKVEFYKPESDVYKSDPYRLDPQRFVHQHTEKWQQHQAGLAFTNPPQHAATPAIVSNPAPVPQHSALAAHPGNVSRPSGSSHQVKSLDGSFDVSTSFANRAQPTNATQFNISPRPPESAMQLQMHNAQMHNSQILNNTRPFYQVHDTQSYNHQLHTFQVQKPRMQTPNTCILPALTQVPQTQHAQPQDLHVQPPQPPMAISRKSSLKKPLLPKVPVAPPALSPIAPAPSANLGPSPSRSSMSSSGVEDPFKRFVKLPYYYNQLKCQQTPYYSPYAPGSKDYWSIHKSTYMFNEQGLPPVDVLAANPSPWQNLSAQSSSLPNSYEAFFAGVKPTASVPTPATKPPNTYTMQGFVKPADLENQQLSKVGQTPATSSASF
ncbi:MAG: hypothetical protein M1829_004100 [Trizodia sp. TS-e1964]|nr:MAG: hypothetical protein M1829_004100 [Trizodia sp. TS-e1964]